MSSARWRRCGRPPGCWLRTSGRRSMTPACSQPAAAAIYPEDIYVERRFSEETVAAVRGLRPWVTSEYEHNGRRVDGGRVLGHLIDLPSRPRLSQEARPPASDAFPIICAR